MPHFEMPHLQMAVFQMVVTVASGHSLLCDALMILAGKKRTPNLKPVIGCLT